MKLDVWWAFIPGFPIVLVAGAALVIAWVYVLLSARLEKLGRSLAIASAVYASVILVYSILGTGFMDGAPLQSAYRAADVLRSSGQALFLYYTDHDETMPPSSGWATLSTPYASQEVNPETAQLPSPLIVDSKFAFAANQPSLDRIGTSDFPPKTILLTEYRAETVEATASDPNLVPQKRHWFFCAVFLLDGSTKVTKRPSMSEPLSNEGWPGEADAPMDGVK
jgi:hypothetical protein